MLENNLPICFLKSSFCNGGSTIFSKCSRAGRCDCSFSPLSETLSQVFREINSRQELQTSTIDIECAGVVAGAIGDE